MAEGSDLKRKFSEEKDGKGQQNAKKFKGHWSQGLVSSMSDPELVVESDDKIVIIKDKYPKAKHHFLILPKDKLSSLKSLTKEHVDVMKHMDRKGRDIAEKTDENLKFRFGYHAVPSMSQLHMHVISQDFNSPCLKHKKHWNSFTTEYFVDSKDIIKMLEKNGKVQLDHTDYSKLLKDDLRCHVCKKTQTNIPKLLAHIKLHSYLKDVDKTP